MLTCGFYADFTNFKNFSMDFINFKNAVAEAFIECYSCRMIVCSSIASVEFSMLACWPCKIDRALLAYRCGMTENGDC